MKIGLSRIYLSAKVLPKRRKEERNWNTVILNFQFKNYIDRLFVVGIISHRIFRAFFLCKLSTCRSD